VHCALGVSPQQGSACSAKRPSHLSWWPISARQGRALGYGGTGGGLTGFRWSLATRCSGRVRGQGGRVVDLFWGGGKEELTGRTCSTVRCGRPEGNGGGGGVRGWCSTARSAGRLYTVAQCLGRGRTDRREVGAGCPRRREWRCIGGRKAEEEERVLHDGGGRPL
jgi:hypothetical protein